MRRVVFERLFDALSEEPDFQYALIDGAIVSVHVASAMIWRASNP